MFVELPGAKFAGTGKETGSTEYPYFLWVDQAGPVGPALFCTVNSSDAPVLATRSSIRG